MTALHSELKDLIIDALQLEDISPEDIKTDAALFGDGLGLDSIDALELGIALQKKYGVVFEENAKDNHVHFASVAALANYIEKNKS